MTRLRSQPHRYRLSSTMLVVVLAALVAGRVSARADGASPLTELVDTAAQRLELAESVAAFKWHAHLAIEDPGRVEQQLTGLGDEARGRQVDPDYVVRVFGDQINASEAIQYQRFADWKLNPAGVPTVPPDLSVSRVAIDALNNKILSQIVLNWSLLASPECPRELEIARTETTRVRRLDDLYQRALETETRSFCQALPPA